MIDLQRFQDVLDAASEGGLSPRLRELAVLLVAGRCDAEALVVQHVDIGRAVGLSDDEIAAVREGDWANPARLGERERVVLAFTAAVLADPQVDPRVFDAMALEFRDRDIVELTMAVGTTFGLARLITVLQLGRDLDSMA